MGKHSASVRRAADLSKQNLLYIMVNAVQDVVEGAMTPQQGVAATGGTFVEGKIPVVDSVLINSLQSGINGARGSASEFSYVAVLAGFKLGDRLEFAWTAPYALRIEKGFVGTDKLGRTYNVPGRHFVGKNAAMFDQFIKNRESEVRS